MVSHVVPLRTIEFTLAKPLVLLNVLLRQPWPKRTRHRRALASEIAVATHRQRSGAPFARADITVVRYSCGSIPDKDNLEGSVKILIDCLVMPGVPYWVKGGKRGGGGLMTCKHPSGLGIIEDDSQEHIVTHISSVLTPHRNQQRTVVTIVELSPDAVLRK